MSFHPLVFCLHSMAVTSQPSCLPECPFMQISLEAEPQLYPKNLKQNVCRLFFLSILFAIITFIWNEHIEVNMILRIVFRKTGFFTRILLPNSYTLTEFLYAFLFFKTFSTGVPYEWYKYTGNYRPVVKSSELTQIRSSCYTINRIYTIVMFSSYVQHRLHKHLSAFSSQSCLA